MKPWVAPVAGIVGLLTGAFVGYVVTERVVRERYDKLLDEEVERVKTFYKRLSNQTSDPESPQEDSPTHVDRSDNSNHISAFTLTEVERTQTKVNELIAELGYEQGLREAEKNIPEFDDTTMSTTEYPRDKMTLDERQVIDYESDEFLELIKNRSDDIPYVITVDEFMDEHKDFDKLSFTYFEGDDIVGDERERPFLEVDSVLGSDNLTMFGQWSKDKDMVYIRNKRLQTDFEVVRDERSFGEVVAGFRPEPKNPIRKMRKSEDD